MLKNIFKIFITPLAVFLLNVFLIIVFDIPNTWPSYDIPMHFLGGAAIGISAILILKFYAPKNKNAWPKWISAIFVLGLVTIAAVWYEFAEFIADYFGHFGTALPLQLGLRDTMGDLFFGTLGGLAVSTWTWMKLDL